MTPNMVRLSAMMFLQFFVWGSWYVSMTKFINQQSMSGLTGAAYTVGPLAAIIAPFFLGMVADRFFSTERVLGVLHILGGVFLIAAPMAAQPFSLPAMPENASLFYQVMIHDLPAFKQPFILLLFGHMLCYMPTLALTASISFRNLENQEKQFPIVRVLGTIGFVAANWAVLLLPGNDISAWQFYMGGGAAILLGLYCFTLPHTPPAEAGEKRSLGQILGLDSLRLFRNPSYAVFMLCSFLICIPLAGYYQQGRNFVEASGVLIGGSATPVMSFGQISEIFFMLVMPFFFIRLGVKNMLAVGMLAWVVRYGLFAGAASSPATAAFAMVMVGILLHGICYDFFFVTGMIYVDKKASADIRNQAQGFLVLVTQGLGLGIGSKLFFGSVLVNTTDGVANWYNIWLFPAIMAGAILVLFYALFWDKTSRQVDEGDVAEAAILEEQP